MTDMSLAPSSNQTPATNGAPDPAFPIGVDPRENLSGRLFEGLIAGMELLTVDLGLALGLYDVLADRALSASELAQALDLDARYVREWAEQQAAAGIVAVDDAGADPGARRYRLDTAHAEVLLDATSPYHLAPAGPLLVGLGRTTPQLRGAIATGEGIAYAAYGAEIREGIAAFNRPMVTAEMASSWLPAMGSVHESLSAADTLHVVDVGCGLGWTSIALAHAYPQAVVRGVDIDQASVAAAREHAAAAGVADRVGFTCADAATFDLDAPVDLVTCFETVHDMADPVGALRTARRLVRDGGHVLVADERTADRFTAPADPYERFLHAFSVLHCLPSTRAEDGPVAHGTLARPDDVVGWFTDAGFADVAVLDVDNDMWRFYLGS